MEFSIRTSGRTDFVNINSQVKEAVRKSGVDEGICVVYVPHTTAAVTINEGADPSVVRDIKNYLDKAVPWNAGYSHGEGNSAAHIKSSIIGCSEHLIVENGQLVLGTWQKIFFCEFDGPRSRRFHVKVVAR